MAAGPNVRYRLWAVASPVFTLAMVGGASTALLHWRPGAYLLIGGVCGLIATRCAIALVEYRRVMARPWPKVAPLTDDD